MDVYPDIITFKVASRHVDQVFQIEVALPRQRAGDPPAPGPVIFAADGNASFAALRSISYGIHAAYPEQRFILVGIGYPGDSPAAGERLRTRDLTFPGYPLLSTAPLPIMGAASAPPGTPDFGGADAFQAFLEEELFPALEARLPGPRRERIFFGHSAAGGFGLYSLFTRPALFDHYIASSPGLAFHGRSSAGVDYDQYEFLLDRARIAKAADSIGETVRLFVAVGDLEDAEPAYAPWRLTGNVRKLGDILREGGSRFALRTEILSDERHMTAWPVAFSRGVRWILGGAPD